MHRFVKEFSTAYNTQKTLARLTYERGDTHYYQAKRAIMNWDYSAAMQFLLTSIYEFKLGSFDAWDKGLSVIEQDECLQRSKQFVRAIKVYYDGKTAENAAQKALVSGDHSNAISYGLQAIEYYNRDYPGYFRSGSAQFLWQHTTWYDCARVKAFLDRVRPEMWLRGGTELRMLLQRHDPVRLQVPLNATQRLHAFLIPTGEDDEDDSENSD